MFIYLNIIQSRSDRDKFEDLYSTYKQTMFYVANKIIKDQYLSEDIVHQAFLRIIDNLDKINEIKCHKTLLTIVSKVRRYYFGDTKLQ